MPGVELVHVFIEVTEGGGIDIRCELCNGVMLLTERVHADTVVYLASTHEHQA